MNEDAVIDAVRILEKHNKIPNLHIRFPVDTFKDGGLLILCDTCDNAFMNSEKRWIHFYVKVPASDFLPAEQDIDAVSQIQRVIKGVSKTPYRIAYRINLEYKKCMGL